MDSRNERSQRFQFIGSWVLLCAALIIGGIAYFRFLPQTPASGDKSATSVTGKFPVGKFKSIGFVVERGNLRFTEKDFHTYLHTATIEQVRQNVVRIVLSIEVRKSAELPKETDTRTDYFLVNWDNETTGTLLNQDSKYEKDRTAFSIEDGKLIFKSYISRHASFETHIYQLDEGAIRAFSR